MVCVGLICCLTGFCLFSFGCGFVFGVWCLSVRVCGLGGLVLFVCVGVWWVWLFVLLFELFCCCFGCLLGCVVAVMGGVF